MRRRAFVTHELLVRIGLAALVVSILMPILAAVRRMMAADPQPTVWQVAGFIAWNLTQAVFLLVFLVAVAAVVMFLVAFVIDRVRAFRRRSR